MKEQWIRWVPIEGLAKNYCLDSICENEEGLKMILSDCDNETKKVLIHFPNFVEAYRNTNESFVLEIIEDLDKRYGTEFYAKWSFFKVTNSEYIRWLSEKSSTISDHLPIIHFCFMTSDEFVDVLNTSEPIVKFID